MVGDLMRKMLLMGVGAALVSKEKMDGIVRDLLSTGSGQRPEGGIAGGLVERASHEYERMGVRVREELRRNMRKTGLVTDDDLKDVKQELYILRQRIAQLEHPKPEGE